MGAELWLDLMWLSVVAYVVFQVILLVRSSGPSRVAAAAPLFVMVPIFVLTAIALAQQSNLWPLFLFFASPVALLYLVVVAVLARPAAKHFP